jgi:L-asparagine oxygenase
MTACPYFDLAHLFPADLTILSRRVASGDTNAEALLHAAFLRTFEALPFGSPFTFREQYGGALVHDIRPSAGHEREESSRGRVTLPFHTDDGFLDPGNRPEHLALLGIFNPERVPTNVVRIESVLELLSAETIAMLREPLFTLACPDSFEAPLGITENVPARPIIWTGPGGRPEASFAPDTRPIDGAGEEVDSHLRQFAAAVGQASRISIVLEPGEILVFSNSRCLHGRPPVEADRWMKRLYLRGDLRQLDRVAATAEPFVYEAARAV